MEPWKMIALSVYLCAAVVGAVFMWRDDTEDVESSSVPVPLFGWIVMAVMFGWIFIPMIPLLAFIDWHEERSWESGKTAADREREAQRIGRRIDRMEKKIQRLKNRQAELRSGKKHIAS